MSRIILQDIKKRFKKTAVLHGINLEIQDGSFTVPVSYTHLLVHEGTAEDYAYFKSILEDNCKGIPYIVCLGNHDRRQAFWEGFLEKTGVAKPYVETTMINGLRIIALDTSPVDGNEIGEMPQEQLDYLAKELKTVAPKGTIVILHHPPQGFVLKGFEGPVSYTHLNNFLLRLSF